MNKLITFIDNNEINKITINNFKLFFKRSDKLFNKLLDSLQNNNSIEEIEFNRDILNDKKIIQIIDILKDKININKIYIYISITFDDIIYINELLKFNNKNIKIYLIISSDTIFKNSNFINFIEHVHLYNYNIDFYNCKNVIINDVYELKIKNSNDLNKEIISSLINNNYIQKLLLENVLFEYETNLLRYNISDIFKYNNSIKTLEIYDNNKIPYNNFDNKFNIDELLNSLLYNKVLENLYINCNKKFNINNGIYYLNNYISLIELLLKNDIIKNITFNNYNSPNIKNISNINELSVIFNKNTTLKSFNIYYNNTLYDINYFKNLSKNYDINIYYNIINKINEDKLKEEEKYKEPKEIMINSIKIAENIANDMINNKISIIDVNTYYKFMVNKLYNLFFNSFKNNISINKIEINNKSISFFSFDKLINMIKNKNNIKELKINFYNNEIKNINKLCELKNINLIFEIHTPYLINNFNFKAFISNNHINKYIIHLPNHTLHLSKEYKIMFRNDVVEFQYKFSNREYKNDIYFIINNCNIDYLDISNLWFNEKIINDIKNNKNDKIKHVEYNDIELANMFKELKEEYGE